MAPYDPVDDPPDVDENDHESDDEDFKPETAPVDESASSSDEEDAAPKPAKARGKRKAPADEELDSGDEVTIQAARKRRAKKRKGAAGDDDKLLLSDDEGGEGGLIKTRAQRRVEDKERKPLAGTEGATVNVDALWAHMLAAPLKPPHSSDAKPADASKEQHTGSGAATADATEEEEQVTVTKVYTFAGQNTTEEKQVPRSSLEKHVADGWKAADAVLEKSTADEKVVVPKSDVPKVRRPLRRPLRFDPNPTGYVRALPPEHQLTWPRKVGATVPVNQENALGPAVSVIARPEKAQKLNVVDKSRLDWSGFVDKEGIAEELDTHGKTKEAYLGRMEFLAGVEARKEEERRRAKTAAAS